MAYKIEFGKFFSYSFSLDCVIFGYEEGQIKVLLIKRAIEPYLGKWAIIGDLVYPDEDLPNAASRILADLTTIDNVILHQGSTFGKPDRHPQGRVITTAYFALVRIDEINAQAESWAEEVCWMPVNKVKDLAFDHKDILDSTYEDLKRKLRYEPVCFDLLPEKFTLNEMQQLYEYAYNAELDKANFRKKIRPIPMIHLKEKQTNVKHRPANLYSFDSERYENLVEEDSYTFKM